MANPNPKTEQLKDTQWRTGESGNPAGKPKGTKHLSTWIREVMEDESFECRLRDGTMLKDVPVKVVVNVLVTRAVNGDLRAFDLLAKYGYGTKVDIESDRTLPVPILLMKI